MTQVPSHAALEFDIRGPGYCATLLLQPGLPGALVGRDTECQVCLPDPNRNVSRRHLAVRNEDGTLHFRVLSMVNGVRLADGEVPPGGTGALQPGQSMRLGDYEFGVRAVRAAPPEDPWLALETQAAPFEPTQGGAHDDPFGDWFARSTFGPGVPGGAAPLEAASLVPATDLRPFLRGLGIDPADVGTLTVGELHEAGQLARAVIDALLALDRDVPAGAVPRRGDNPLKQGQVPELLLRYLFSGRAASGGALPPLHAVNDLVADLRRRIEHTREPEGAQDAGA